MCVCVCVCVLVGVYSGLAEGAMLLLTGVGGGVTHLSFSPDGNLLFVGFRKVTAQVQGPEFRGHFIFQSDVLKVWDLRNPSNHLAQLCRPVHTNQRLYFDLYREHYLLSGCGDGRLLAWDTASMVGSSDLPPLLTHNAHNDPVTGCR